MTSATTEPPAPGGPGEPAGGGDDLQTAGRRALDAIAGAATLADLEAARSRHLGRGDGLLTGFLRRVGEQPPEVRKQFAQAAQQLVRQA